MNPLSTHSRYDVLYWCTAYARVQEDSNVPATSGNGANGDISPAVATLMFDMNDVGRHVYGAGQAGTASEVGTPSAPERVSRSIARAGIGVARNGGTLIGNQFGGVVFVEWMHRMGENWYNRAVGPAGVRSLDPNGIRMERRRA